MVQVGMKYAASSAPLNELIRQFVDMSLPAFRMRSGPERRLCGEVTPLNCGGQFKPFVYLNGRIGGTGYLWSAITLQSSPPGLTRESILFARVRRRRWMAGSKPGHDEGERLPQTEKSRLSAGLSLTLAQFRSALVTRPLVRVRLLVLTARVLLLLARLLATALLLAGLLARVLILLTRGLILLARILVLFGHRGRLRY